MIQMKRKVGNKEPYYDLDDDWDLVVASFQSEYGIRLSKELSGMSWREFSYFINGLSGDSPLGRIICIRAENDPEILKNFTPEQKKIRNDYRRQMAKQKTESEVNDALESIKQAFISLAK